MSRYWFYISVLVTTVFLTGCRTEQKIEDEYLVDYLDSFVSQNELIVEQEILGTHGVNEIYVSFELNSIVAKDVIEVPALEVMNFLLGEKSIQLLEDKYEPINRIYIRFYMTQDEVRTLHEFFIPMPMQSEELKYKYEYYVIY